MTLMETCGPSTVARSGDRPQLEEAGDRPQQMATRSGDRSQLAGSQLAGPQSEIGRTEWSDFEIRDELGRGGMGVVHLAWQRSLERLVAIKTLHPFMVRSEDLFQRFRQEAVAAAQLHHPHIVRVMAYGEVSATPFYVMSMSPVATWLSD